MLIITGYALFNQLTNKTINQKTITNQKADLSIIIKGMTCNHCKESAMEAIQACNGVEKVTINLENGQTIINGKSIDEQEIIESVNGIGFSVSKLA